MNKQFIKFIKFFLVSILGWFIINPFFTINYIILGMIVSIITGLILSYAIDSIFYKHIINFSGYFTKPDFYRYFAFMTKEIITSTVDVLKHGIDFKKPYESQIITIKLPEKTGIDKILIVTLSIIMTPGTTIINTNGTTLTVHCLTKNAHHSMEEMTFVNKILLFNF